MLTTEISQTSLWRDEWFMVFTLKFNTQKWLCCHNKPSSDHPSHRMPYTNCLFLQQKPFKVLTPLITVLWKSELRKVHLQLSLWKLLWFARLSFFFFFKECFLLRYQIAIIKAVRRIQMDNSLSFSLSLCGEGKRVNPPRES